MWITHYQKTKIQGGNRSHSLIFPHRNSFFFFIGIFFLSKCKIKSEKNAKILSFLTLTISFSSI